MVSDKLFNRMTTPYHEFSNMSDFTGPLDDSNFVHRFILAGQKYVVEARNDGDGKWQVLLGTGDANGWFSVAEDDLTDVIDAFAMVIDQFVKSKQPGIFTLIYDRDFTGANANDGEVVTTAASVNNLIIDKVIKDVDKSVYDVENPMSKENVEFNEETPLEVYFVRK